MQVITKFNIGSNVFIIWNGKAEEVLIESITVNITKHETEIVYRIAGFSSTVNERRVFATKQELLDSI